MSSSQCQSSLGPQADTRDYQRPVASPSMWVTSEDGGCEQRSALPPPRKQAPRAAPPLGPYADVIRERLVAEYGARVAEATVRGYVARLPRERQRRRLLQRVIERVDLDIESELIGGIAPTPR